MCKFVLKQYETIVSFRVQFQKNEQSLEKKFYFLWLGYQYRHKSLFYKDENERILKYLKLYKQKVCLNEKEISHELLAVFVTAGTSFHILPAKISYVDLF